MRTGGWVMNESVKRAIKSIAFIFVFILLGRPDVVAAKSNEKQAFFFNDEQAHEVVFNGIPNDVKNLLRTGYEYKCSTLLIEVVRRAARGRHANKYPFLSYKLKIL